MIKAAATNGIYFSKFIRKLSLRSIASEITKVEPSGTGLEVLEEERVLVSHPPLGQLSDPGSLFCSTHGYI